MSSQVTFAKFEEAYAFEVGADRTTGNWSSDRDNLFQYLKKDAVSRFEQAHRWSFLYPEASLELVPSYTTGTIAIAAGVVTGTGTTFPSWAAAGDLWVTDDGEMRRYSVDSRDSDTQLTLDDTGVAVTAGATYTLRRHWYNLPADFAGALDRSFAFRRDSVYAGMEIVKVGLAEFQQLDRDIDAATGTPCYFTLQPIPATSGASTTWKVGFTPLPGDTLFLDYRYRANPADVSSTQYPEGGAAHSETMLASFKYSIALYKQLPNAEERRLEYMRRLQDSINMDGHNRPIDYGSGRNGSYGRYGERHVYGSIDDATIFGLSH